MTGIRIGQYTILEKIGEGGMGAVWKARDEKLGRKVALKFLSKLDSPDARARFTQEARAASSLSHPGIVTIHDIFDHDDKACIVMEFVEGSTLTGLIPAAGMKAREVVRLGTQIADALSAAHKSGVIHRDLKPGNIMVTPDGRAKLLDFGLAKMAEIAAATPGDHTQTLADVRTTEGSILGTVNYMSPEQAQGKPVDTRSDIFSLGAVLYEMANGQKAFQGDTTISTITAILRDEPAGLPHELGRVIGRCLRKEPDRRFQTALDVRNALEEVHEEIKSGVSGLQPVPQAPAATPVRRWMIAAAAGVLALCFGIWALMSFSGTPAPPVDSIVVRPFSGLSGLKSNPNFSPDGNTIVMAWDGGQLGSPSNIYAMLLDGGKPLRLTNTAHRDVLPFYSRDGRRVFFTRASEGEAAVFSIPALGGDETKVASGSAQAVSADGQWLLVGRNSFLGFSPAESGVFVVPVSGGPERLVLRFSTDFVYFDFNISPDGKWIFFSRAQVGQSATAMRIPFEGGQPEPVRLPALENQTALIESIQFFGQNTGMRVIALEKGTNTQRVWLLKSDGTRPVQLPRTVPSGAISHDGHRAIGVSAYSVTPLYRVPAFPARGQKATPEKALDSPRAEQTPRVSPDGSRIAISSNRSGRSMLWVWNAALTDGRPLYEQQSATSGSPVWSPDGQWIVFDARVQSNVPDIWIISSGGGLARQLTEHSAENNTPCFDSKGEWIYFTSDREGGQQLYKIAPVGGTPTRITKGGGFSCQASPDGKFLYYLQSRDRGGLWRLELATGKEEPVLPDYKNRNFKVLSDGIYLLDFGTTSQSSISSRPGTAMFYRFATRKIEHLGFNTPRPVGPLGIDVSPDRKWLYFSMLDAQASDLQLAENLPFR